jgi:hypothetical protein
VSKLYDQLKKAALQRGESAAAAGQDGVVPPHPGGLLAPGLL